MRLPRFTTRRLMALVAVVAALAAGGLETRKLMEVSRSYQQHAARSAALEQFYARRPRPASAAYHAAMKRKYDRHARYPWLPVPPDPPPPE